MVSHPEHKKNKNSSSSCIIGKQSKLDKTPHKAMLSITHYSIAVVVFGASLSKSRFCFGLKKKSKIKNCKIAIIIKGFYSIFL